MKWLLLAAFVVCTAGCAAVDKDPILGKTPFEPGAGFPKAESTKNDFKN